jgi:hypothetical protein
MTRPFVNVVFGVLVLSALPLGRVSAYDGYAAPGPGSYLEGSGRAAGDPRYDSRGSTRPGDYVDDSGSEWYSSDWFRDQVEPDYRGYGTSRDGYWRDDPRSSPRPEDRPHDYPAAGDYRRDRRREDSWQYRDEPYRDQRYRSDQEHYGYEAPAYRRERLPESDRQPDWSGPRRRPQYRFRDDPELQGGRYTGPSTGFRFRPLTEKELQRRRESADRYEYAAPVPMRRRSEPESRTRRDREEAFGYEPDAIPDSFYDRYYRSGP